MNLSAVSFKIRVSAFIHKETLYVFKLFYFACDCRHSFACLAIRLQHDTRTYPC